MKATKAIRKTTCKLPRVGMATAIRHCLAQCDGKRGRK